MAFFPALAFVVGIVALVLLAEPPTVVVAIIAVIVVGVLLKPFAPSSALGRARGRRTRVKNRAVAHRPQGATTDPIYDQES